jgi:hypothetical protein
MYFRAMMQTPVSASEHDLDSALTLKRTASRELVAMTRVSGNNVNEKPSILLRYDVP